MEPWPKLFAILKSFQFAIWNFEFENIFVLHNITLIFMGKNEPHLKGY